LQYKKYGILPKKRNFVFKKAADAGNKSVAFQKKYQKDGIIALD
jgi:hypothetical protein